MLRYKAFYAASDVYENLDDMENSVLANYVRKQISGKETQLTNHLKSVKPIRKITSSNVFIDYSINSGEMITQEYEEYKCPVCDWFVSSHEFPILYSIPAGYGKMKPCNYCMFCGQKIDWTGIELDPDLYEQLPTNRKDSTT